MKLAVLGSPIAHSKSPRIHAAAYRALGLDWEYSAVELQRETLPAWLESLGSEWHGFSVTAPLKEAAAAWAVEVDDAVTQTSACNTLLVHERRGFNTDIAGITDAFRAVGVSEARRGVVLGAGATAVSSVVALYRMGVKQIAVRLRNTAKAQRLCALGAQLGIIVSVADFTQPVPETDVVVSTLPAAADVAVNWDSAPRALLDADYASGPSRFSGLDTVLVPGIEMLLHQALVQVRIFVLGNPESQLNNEAAVWQSMRDAVS